jgi:HD-like signal output (HDOD) protein
VFSLMPNPKCGPFDLKSLWQDSLRRGLFARAMGKRLGLKDAEDLFAAALLQDMAVPLLAKELTKDYTELLNARAGGQRRLSELERQRFGWTHADAAARMARNWSLPEEFAVLIEGHTDLEQAAASVKASPGVFSVALSALLPSAADEQWHDHDRFIAAFASACAANGALEETLAQVDDQFEEFAPVLRVSAPARSLVECLSAQAAAV